MQKLEAHATSNGGRERVWALLADAKTWTDWAGFDDAAVEKGSGLGEHRRFRLGRTRSRELVTVWEPPSRFGYDLVEGLPIRDYHAEVELSETPDGGTEIVWRSSFRPKVPGTGWLIRRRLQAFIAKTTDGLARAAER
jgi:hypothetical protein